MVMLPLGWKWTSFLVVSLVVVVARGFRLRRGECSAPLLFGAGERVTPLLGGRSARKVSEKGLVLVVERVRPVAIGWPVRRSRQLLFFCAVSN